MYNPVHRWRCSTVGTSSDSKSDFALSGVLKVRSQSDFVPRIRVLILGYRSQLLTLNIPDIAVSSAFIERLT